MALCCSGRDRGIPSYSTGDRSCSRIVMFGTGSRKARGTERGGGNR